MQIVKVTQIKNNPQNPRIIKDDAFKKLVQSIIDFPDMLNKRPLVCFTDVDGKYVVLGGNMRLKASMEAGLKEVPIMLANDWTEEQKREFIIKDNVGFGEWDYAELMADWDYHDLDKWGLTIPNFDSQNEPEELIGEEKNKPPTLKITFPNEQVLISIEPKIKDILNQLCPEAYYSVSAGEI